MEPLGISGLTIEEYRKDLDGRLKRLAERLKAGTYEARPIRRVYIPKSNGKLRPLGIPELEDRIVQAALVRVIEPIFEAKFVEMSFRVSARVQRSGNALEELTRALQEGFTQLVDADICDCFGSIPWAPMLDEVAQEIADPKVLALIRQFVRAKVIGDRDDAGSRTGARPKGRCSPRCWRTSISTASTSR